jgi:hypothetical protein
VCQQVLGDRHLVPVPRQVAFGKSGVAIVDLEGDALEGVGMLAVGAEAAARHPLRDVGAPAQVVVERGAVLVGGRPGS